MRTRTAVNASREDVSFRRQRDAIFLRKEIASPRRVLAHVGAEFALRAAVERAARQAGDVDREAAALQPLDGALRLAARAAEEEGRRGVRAADADRKVARRREAGATGVFQQEVSPRTGPEKGRKGCCTRERRRNLCPRFLVPWTRGSKLLNPRAVLRVVRDTGFDGVDMDSDGKSLRAQMNSLRDCID